MGIPQSRTRIKLGVSKGLEIDKMMTMVPRSGKVQYSEAEAADELGVTIEQLRSLVQHHIVEGEEGVPNVPVSSFHPSDLVVLRILAAMQANSQPH